MQEEEWEAMRLKEEEAVSPAGAQQMEVVAVRMAAAEAAAEQMAPSLRVGLEQAAAEAATRKA